MPNYWVVGAMFGGKEDQYKKFIEQGYWFCWDPKLACRQAPTFVESRFLQIKSDDRIAVKKLLGRGSNEIEIRAIGTVKDVDLKEWRVYVDWTLKDIKRKVPLHGCAASLHGPFRADDEWVQRVFQI